MKPSISKSLSEKIVQGGSWLLLLRIINKSLGIVKTIILARLLAPDDFGLFGIAILTISTVEAFSQTGFQYALIQKKGNKDLNNAILEFKNMLGKITLDLFLNGKKKLIIIIDELDRCRPSYAIETIEKIKHLFSVLNLCC